MQVVVKDTLNGYVPFPNMALSNGVTIHVAGMPVGP